MVHTVQGHSMNQQPTSNQQTTASIAPIDPALLVKHGKSEDSSVTVILAIAILISILITGITGLVRVIMLTKASR